MRDIEASELAESLNGNPTSVYDDPTDGIDKPSDVTLEDSLRSGPDLTPVYIEDNLFSKAVEAAYQEDTFFKLILDDPEANRAFHVRDGMVWMMNNSGVDVVCILRGTYMEHSLHEVILDQAHEVLGHYGYQCTSEYVCRWYWWPKIVSDTREFCKTCSACQQVKGGNKPPAGKLHTLPIPSKPWDSIGMDFVGPFPEVEVEHRKFNYLWVIVCRLTSMVHLIPVHTTMTASQLSAVYMREIVRLHGLPTSIVSDRNSKFTSKWWRELHRMLGSRLLMSTSFHPQTDGMTERMNRSVGQIFHTAVQPDQKNWYFRIDPTEFAINSSISQTTRFAPFKLNGGYLPSMMREYTGTSSTPPGVRKFAMQALANIAEAHDLIIANRVFQTHQANRRRSNEPSIKKGDLVYLSTKNLNLPKERARKLCPKFIGPYKVEIAYPDTSNYTLQLPSALQQRQIHPTFHVSLLCPYHANNDTLFPNRSQPDPYDFGADDDAEWFVEDIVSHRWNKSKLEFEVKWSLGETTWEPLAGCNDLAALDRYLEIMGVRYLQKLPRRGKALPTRKNEPVKLTGGNSQKGN